MKLKYVDSSNKEELELIARIYNSKNKQIISFMETYHILKNMRIELSGTSSILVDEEVWPRINFANTALKKYIYENDNESYIKVDEYIHSDLYDLSKSESKELKREFNQLLNDKLINESLRNKIKMDVLDKILNIQGEKTTNVRTNDIIFTISSNIWYDYYNNYIKSLLEEKKMNKRNFKLGVILSIVGILVSIALTVYSMS